MAQVTAGPTIAAEEDPAKHPVAVGGYVCAAAPVSFHPDLKVTTLKVRNTGDRPVQVGSHFHFFEVNPRAGVRSRRCVWPTPEHPGRGRAPLRARR